MPDSETPTVEYRGGIYYLVLDGNTHFERGHQHGSALKFPIKKALTRFRDWNRDLVGLEDPETMVQDFSRNTPYMASAQKDAPDLWEEMRVVAAVVGKRLARAALSS